MLLGKKEVAHAMTTVLVCEPVILRKGSGPRGHH
jgi:hypothetical protein